MKLTSLIKELVLIVSLFLGVILIFWFGSQVYSGNTALDIALNDTYFTIAGRLFVIPVSLSLIAGVYIIKEAFHGYRRRFQNMILLTSIFLINIELLLYGRIAAKLAAHTTGWVIYPPLSALPKTLPDPPVHPSPLFSHAWQILLFIQIFFLVILVIIATITGKNWNINREQKIY